MKCKHERRYLRFGKLHCEDCGFVRHPETLQWVHTLAKQHKTMNVGVTPEAHHRITRIVEQLSYQNGVGRVSVKELLSNIIMSLRTSPELLEEGEDLTFTVTRQ